MIQGLAVGSPLPRSTEYYLHSPGETLKKLREWLAGRYWLRSCTRVGAWTRVTGKIFVQNSGSITIGDRVRFHSHCVHSVLTTYSGGRIEIGDRTFVNYGADLCATNLVRIGADCLLGTHVIILDNDFHDLVERQRVPEPKPVIIGDHVWIGNRATILPGVTIGDGAVVGAGSVVTRDVPAHTLVAGNPARVVKTL